MYAILDPATGKYLSMLGSMHFTDNKEIVQLFDNMDKLILFEENVLNVDERFDEVLPEPIEFTKIAIDLFAYWELIPENVNNVLQIHKHGERYTDIENLIKDMQLVGYSVDYGLDADPYELRPLLNTETIKTVALNTQTAELSEFHALKILKAIEKDKPSDIITLDYLEGHIETYLLLLGTEQTG